MFSHIMIGSNDIARSKKFYDALFTAIGGQPGTEPREGRLAYAHNGSRFMVTKPNDGKPTVDGLDLALHRGEVRAHRHDRYVAPASFAPRRYIAGPLVVPATVLLDGLETECIGIPAKLEQLSRDPRLDLHRLGLGPA